MSSAVETQEPLFGGFNFAMRTMNRFFGSFFYEKIKKQDKKALNARQHKI